MDSVRFQDVCIDKLIDDQENESTARKTTGNIPRYTEWHPRNRCHTTLGIMWHSLKFHRKREEVDFNSANSNKSQSNCAKHNLTIGIVVNIRYCSQYFRWKHSRWHYKYPDIYSRSWTSGQEIVNVQREFGTDTLNRSDYHVIRELLLLVIIPF